jgi:uncharacterized membrane protein YidH (DUF202 family)
MIRTGGRTFMATRKTMIGMMAKGFMVARICLHAAVGLDR